MINEIELKDIEKKLNAASYGALKNEFATLGIEIKKQKHEKKADLIKRAIAKYVEMRGGLAQSLEEDGVDNKDCAKNDEKTIYCEDQNGKRQNSPNPDQNHLTSNLMDKTSVTKSDSQKPDLKTDSQNTDSGKQVEQKESVATIVNKAVSKIQNLKSEITQNQKQNRYNGLSKEVIKKNIQTMKANLKDALPDNRIKLLKKMEELEKLL